MHNTKHKAEIDLIRAVSNMNTPHLRSVIITANDYTDFYDVMSHTWLILQIPAAYLQIRTQPEGKGIRFFQNVDIYPPDYMESHHKRLSH
jgi:hypothetical protein